MTRINSLEKLYWRLNIFEKGRSRAELSAPFGRSSLSGAYRKGISDFDKAPSKFPPLRSGTSDMPQPLYETGFLMKEKNILKRGG